MPSNPKEVQLDISFASRMNALKMPWHVPPGVHHLMLVLELYCGPDRDFCWPALGTLAEVMNVTDRQVRRLIAQAIELELLFEIVETTDGKKRRHFKVRQANMIERARRIKKEKPARPRRRRSKRTSRPNVSDTLSENRDKVSQSSDTLSGISDKVSQVSDNVSEPYCLYEFESTKKVQTESSSPPPPQPGWKEVEEVVVRFPIGDWRPAVEAAQRAGCSPAQVLAIVAEAKRRRGQWDEGKAPGILRRRLFNAHPAGLVTDGWPSPHTAAQARQRAMAEASQRTAERVAEANQEAERAAARAKRAELEAAFGLELDALPEEDLHDLVRAVLGANQLAWAKWKEAPDISSEIFRGPVLRYIATREGVGHAAK